MSEQSTSPHPIFQPLPTHDGLAVQHLLWVISGKVFIKPSGCWFWGGARSEAGYGVLEVRGKIHRVTRILYAYCVASLADGALVLHHCDNPPCCRLDHLYAGSHSDNAKDALARGQAATILTPELVKEMRRLESGSYRRKWKVLGDMFGVSSDAAWEACRGRTWKNIK